MDQLKEYRAKHHQQYLERQFQEESKDLKQETVERLKQCKADLDIKSATLATSSSNVSLAYSTDSEDADRDSAAFTFAPERRPGPAGLRAARAARAARGDDKPEALQSCCKDGTASESVARGISPPLAAPSQSSSGRPQRLRLGTATCSRPPRPELTPAGAESKSPSGDYRKHVAVQDRE
eukprot:TRINITY_DN58331_c0_g1_i1.p1 TRINITY_DN58331_c0_g1~~TRINITY_DN58331_c0_g1_i1.p1  ORF type:complete len:180 (+),score=25.46 TRINITY_DN58331_c0_g1_i1:50-589(+)